MNARGKVRIAVIVALCVGGAVGLLVGASLRRAGPLSSPPAAPQPLTREATTALETMFLAAIGAERGAYERFRDAIPDVDAFESSD